MSESIAQRLRDAVQTLRRTSMPLKDLIPLLTKAADELDEVKTRSEKLREAGFTRRPSWKSLPKDGEE